MCLRLPSPTRSASTVWSFAAAALRRGQTQCILGTRGYKAPKGTPGPWGRRRHLWKFQSGEQNQSRKYQCKNWTVVFHHDHRHLYWLIGDPKQDFVCKLQRCVVLLLVVTVLVFIHFTLTFPLASEQIKHILFKLGWGRVKYIVRASPRILHLRFAFE